MTTPSDLRLDPRPTAVELEPLIEHLRSLFDPFEPYTPTSKKEMDPDYSPLARVKRCGSTASHWWEGTTVATQNMCGSLRCKPCARWKVKHERRPASWHGQYDQMVPAVFDGVPVVYVMPFIHGRKKAAAVVRQGNLKASWWLRIQTASTSHLDLGFIFSDRPVSTRNDLWEPWTLSPEDARRFYLEDLLVPYAPHTDLFIAHKPTCSVSFPWALAPDADDDDDEGKGGEDRKLGGSTSDITSKVVEMTNEFITAREKQVRAEGGRVEHLPPGWRKKYHQRAVAIALEERDLARESKQLGHT